MMNMFLNADPLWGLKFMDATWITVAIILIVVGEIAMGVFANVTDDCLESMFFPSLLLVFFSIFWPCVLLIIVGAVIIAMPLLVGYYIPKWIIKYVNHLKEKKRKGVNKLMYKD